MSKTSTVSTQPFLVQIYFVFASLLGLILLIIGSVSAVQLGLKQVLGVQRYPSFMAPYPSDELFRTANMDSEVLTEDQQKKWAEWEAMYDAWKESERAFNSQDQEMRRDLVVALAMLIVGIPVFAIHAPYVFRRK